jgi:hypothetical protein
MCLCRVLKAPSRLRDGALTERKYLVRKSALEFASDSTVGGAVGEVPARAHS